MEAHKRFLYGKVLVRGNEPFTISHLMNIQVLINLRKVTVFFIIYSVTCSLHKKDSKNDV